MNEVWLPIRGYEERYEISNLGRVRSLQFCGVRRTLILKQLANRGGYLGVALHKGGKQVTRMVHTLVAEAFIGPRPAGFTINHKSGVKAENCESNLEYCTLSENHRHAFKLGLSSYKGTRSRHVLDDEKISHIDSYLRQGVLQRDIAAFLRVDQSCISRVKTRARWSHIDTGGSAMNAVES